MSTFNPFEEKPKKVEDTLMSLKELAPKPYNKDKVDPYTRVRTILMNGNEYEAVKFGHTFHRHCMDNDIRRELALMRRIEQQQQKAISALKPIDEDFLENAIGYEQLAVDLTAFLAQRAKAGSFKDALDFALLEDFDHLYRYADLLDMDQGIKAEELVGGYTELMPGRPTIAHHRHPFDSVKNPLNHFKADPMTCLDAAIITAAEQQTMNYYMNHAAYYKNDLGRRLVAEIGMVEEQHVTQYGSFLDPTMTWFESCLMHEYTECYLYWSMMEDETDKDIKKFWEKCLVQEIAHLHMSAKHLKKCEHKDWEEVLKKGEFPAPIKFKPNKDYIRKILGKTVTLTANREEYEDVSKMPKNADFFVYQKKCLLAKPEDENAHVLIENYIEKNGEDYRYQDKEHPVKELRDRKEDNYKLGR